MILLTVGTQFPFDRLVRAVDEWAISVGRTDIVAQIGPTNYKPRNMKCFSYVTPDEFRSLQENADLMIAHAGMGSILTALEFGKPILIMPRDHERGEHRNGHQFSTVKRFADTSGVYAVDDEIALRARLDDIPSMKAATLASGQASDQLVQELNDFISTPAQRRPVWRWFGKK